MNDNSLSPVSRVAAGAAAGQRQGRSPRRLTVKLAAVSWSLVGASYLAAAGDGLTKTVTATATVSESAPVLTGTNAPAAGSLTGASGTPATARTVSISTSASASVVVASSPLMDSPAGTALSQLAARPTGVGLESRMNRDTLQDAIDRGSRQFTVEQAGSALRYLRRKPTWRGVWDLLDPLAPVEKVETPAATAFETRGSLGPAPRSFLDPVRDPATHEPQLRVF